MSVGAAIVGYGKMGRAVAEVWQERGHEVQCTLGRGDDLEAAQPAGVAFEFTQPEAAPDNVTTLLRLGLPTVSGTTGWNPESAVDLADELGVPLLVAPNFSIGVAVLKTVVAEAARRLAAFEGFEPGIVERHHGEKRDSPSGTAGMLTEVIAACTGHPPPVVALRHGGQPGEHRVIFEGSEESLELVHRARSRRVFAEGAVAAAEWLAKSEERGFVSFERFLEEVATGSR